MICKSYEKYRRLLSGLFLLSAISILFTCCEAQVITNKINGLSLVASRDEISPQDFAPITNVNANAIAVMPFGFMQDLNSPELRFNMERQWWGEKEEGVNTTISLAKANGLTVLLKPQIWIRRGEFTGHIAFRSEEDWQKFENHYRDFVLFYAGIAEKEKVEMLAIGTELNSFVEARPDFWKSLIKEVREVYNGEITYAENWDKIGQVHFWKDLDYIGVDAYFPLNENQSPDIEELRAGWQPHKKELKELSKRKGKPILFTEYGYRNIDFAAKNPWDSSRENHEDNDQLQADALEALYSEIWNENWFAGGFLWKWHQDHERSGGLENNQFTPQNKPAELVVRDFYGSHLTK